MDKSLITSDLSFLFCYSLLSAAVRFSLYINHFLYLCTRIQANTATGSHNLFTRSQVWAQTNYKYGKKTKFCKTATGTVYS